MELEGENIVPYLQQLTKALGFRLQPQAENIADNKKHCISLNQ